MIDHLVDHAQRKLRGDRTVLWEQRAGVLVERARVGLGAPDRARAQQCWETGVAVVRTEGADCFVALPVLGRAGQVMGVLEVATARTVELTLAQTLAEAIGAALDQPEPVFSEPEFFLNRVLVPSWIRDASGRYTRVNQAFATLMGRTIAQLVGKRPGEVMPPAEAAQAERADQRVLAEGRTHHFESRWTSPEGVVRAFWVIRFPVLDARGAVGLAGLAMEITDHERAAAALPHPSARLRQVFEVLHDGVFIQHDGVLRFANQRMATLLGAGDPAALVGSSWRSFVLSDDHDAVEAELARLEHSPPRTTPMIRRLRRRDGSVALVELTAIRVDDEGRSEFAVIVRDITSQRQREEQLQLNARLATVGALAATVAHEINNPLAFMMTNLHLLGQDLRAIATAPPTAQQLKLMVGLVDDASHGVERIRSIVKAMGTLARETHDRVSRPHLLAPLIDGALQLTSVTLRQRARLEVSVGPLPAVDADETELSQVLVSLLTNAAEAITSGPAQDHLIQVVALTALDGQAVIEVRDSGSGIAPEHLQRIFEPFFSTKASSPGAGLGLSIARHVVESFKGQLSVESRLGVGSTFRVTLPPSAQAQPTATAERTPAAAQRASVAQGGEPPTPSSEAEASAAKRGRVLIVDDEPMIGKVLARGLRELHDTVVVTTGRAALAELEKGGFDAVISDVMMPGMDGMSFFSELERRFPSMAARTIFISGGTFTPGTRELLERLPNPCLDKPLNLQRLTDLVGRLVAGQG